MEKLNLINGNGQNYEIGLPKILIIAEFINDVWLDLVYKESGLKFKKGAWHSYTAQPTKSEQVIKLLIQCGGAKTRYYNNWDHNNTLMIKFDHHVGFDVDSICLDCVGHNNINVNGLKPGDRLSC